jgi:hypothetical protein
MNQPTYVNEISRMATSKGLKKKALELMGNCPSYETLGASEYISNTFDKLLLTST